MSKLSDRMHILVSPQEFKTNYRSYDKSTKKLLLLDKVESQISGKTIATHYLKSSDHQRETTFIIKLRIGSLNVQLPGEFSRGHQCSFRKSVFQSNEELRKNKAGALEVIVRPQ